jgi:hypothetical protein
LFEELGVGGMDEGRGKVNCIFISHSYMAYKKVDIAAGEGCLT